MKEDAKKWLDKAEDDIKKAKDNFKMENYDLASFMGQQAAEKALKAVLIEKKDRLEKTHDLVKLGRMVNIDESLLDECKKLTPVLTETRYPDVREEPYTKEESTGDIDAAERIIKWVKTKIS